MELDVLSMSVGVSQNSYGGGGLGLKASIFPRDEKIRICEGYTFSRPSLLNVGGRIEASLHVILADQAHTETVSALLPKPVGEGRKFNGYASVSDIRQLDEALEPAGNREPFLQIVLFADPSTLSELIRQVDQIAPASMELDVWIEGLEFASLPDEFIWPCDEKTDGSLAKYLPISQWTASFQKLTTTALAIGEAQADRTIVELAAANDAGVREAARRELSLKAGGAVSREATLLAACRSLLGALLIVSVVALLRSFR